MRVEAHLATLMRQLANTPWIPHFLPRSAFIPLSPVDFSRLVSYIASACAFTCLLFRLFISATPNSTPLIRCVSTMFWRERTVRRSVRILVTEVHLDLSFRIMLHLVLRHARGSSIHISEHHSFVPSSSRGSAGGWGRASAPTRRARGAALLCARARVPTARRGAPRARPARRAARRGPGDAASAERAARRHGPSTPSSGRSPRRREGTRRRRARGALPIRSARPARIR